MTDDNKRNPVSLRLRDAFKDVFTEAGLRAAAVAPIPVMAAPSQELATAQALIADLQRENEALKYLSEEGPRLRTRVTALRQALMDIMTGNAVAPDPVPEPIMKLAHEVLREDDALAKEVP